MSSRAGVRVGLAAVLPLTLSLLAPASAFADTEPATPTRATIRGTGNDVSIVYRGASGAPPRRAEAKPPQADVVLDATRMAERGADDRSLIAFFRTHQAELPPVVDREAVRRLRKAGAGPEVVSDLSRLTALDIGETAEGAPVQNAYGYEAPSAYDAPFPSADMGYPFYGSYGGYGSGLAPRHHHGGRLGGGFPRHSTLPARPHAPSRPVVAPRSTHGGMGRFRQP